MKFLIYTDFHLSERAGGPATYLYNLKKGFSKLGITENIKIISNPYRETTEGFKVKIFNIIKKRMPKLHEKILMKKYSLKVDNVSLGQYDLVMFHSTCDYYRNVYNIPQKTVKVLMSHCPEAPAQEFIYSLKTQYCENYEYLKLKALHEEIDRFAFSDADYIIFPSIDAMEPYYATINNFAEIIKNKEIKFLMTGTSELTYDINCNDFRMKYNIPRDAIVLSYVGRYNEIKGFNTLISIMRELLNLREDIYIVTAGVGPLEPLNSSRWINIGWTNDPGSVINASDLFILPNKQTYFDLILLEVLSLGKPVVASNKGGNKTIAELTEGVVLFNDYKEAVELIENMITNKKELQEKGKVNRKLFELNFTVDKFVERYINLFKEIESEVNNR